MRVKTIVQGTINGLVACFEELDRRTNSLGADEIISIDDKLYPLVGTDTVEHIARTVVYRCAPSEE